MRFTFPLALTFLTIIPWPRQGLAGSGDLARSMFWFPWVGALLGLIYWGAWAGLGRIFPAPAAAALLLALTVISTRGLHLDGLADTVDGLGGGRDHEARLRIMKDSALGAFGAASLILALLVKYAFFLSLGAGGAGRIFFFFPVVSRWGMVLLAYLSPYARKEGGLGQAMTLGVTGPVVWGATLGAGAMALLAAGPAGVVLMAAAGGVVLLMKFYFAQKLGGITGDVLGAANEVLEILALSGGLVLALFGREVLVFPLFW
ncbi:MAG: adenosylcobinamide-GDP ribazoletransferase [Deltaproteobacteria bacterium]|nr:adenosylcobinamide-GDP ribazoletransferase [Deltaproteobacteria bacterium]